MIKTEIDTFEFSGSADERAWRDFWLTNVMIEKGRPLPVKNVRPRTPDADESLTGRLHQLRAMESAEVTPTRSN